MQGMKKKKKKDHGEGNAKETRIGTRIFLLLSRFLYERTFPRKCFTKPWRMARNTLEGEIYLFAITRRALPCYLGLEQVA